MWKEIQEYRAKDLHKGMHGYNMALSGHMKEWKEIVDELKECGVEYTRKISHE